MDSYWDLYVAYIAKCVRENWINDIDPHHYKMEWNHWLPKACFPDLPVGQWLTLKQHAIASALQTLAFQKKCLCGWHQGYLPDTLLQLTKIYLIEDGRKLGEKNKQLKRGICNPGTHKLPYVVEAKRQNGRKVADRFMDEKKGIFDPQFEEKIRETQVKSGNDAVINKTGIHNPDNREIVLAASKYALENKKGVFDPANKEKVIQGSKKSGRQAVVNKTGIFSPDYEEKHSEVASRVMTQLHSVKDESGKSVLAVKNARNLHSKKDENGKSVVAMKMNSQVWESLIDGHRYTASGVSRHNTKNGWDPKARIRIS